MAVVRNCAALVMLLVATVFVASSVTAVAADASNDGWDQYLADKQAEYMAKQSAMGIQAAADTGTSKFPPLGETIVIDIKGTGKFKTIQAAIDSIPDGNKKRMIFDIRDGTYKQKLRIPSQKPFIYFKCQSRKVVITWGDTAEKAGGTALSASTAVECDHFIASDCTFKNSAPAPPGGSVGKQAVALRIQGDKAAFYRCVFLRAQDSLYDKEGRHYFHSCEIYGSIDWIFGDGQSFYQLCLLVSIAEANSGSVTAEEE